MAEQNFRVNVDNFLSFEHDEYKNACYSLAISPRREMAFSRLFSMLV
jgi:hypothetical protein